MSRIAWVSRSLQNWMMRSREAEYDYSSLIDFFRNVNSVTGDYRERMNRLIVLGLVLAVVYFGVDKFVLAPHRDAALVAATTETVKAEAGAGKQAQALETLLAAAPALAPKVEAAEWVGNRRWNLTFRTGQVLALPEGEDRAASAFLSFARMDGVNRLLGGKVAAFDMRAQDRVYMRVPGHAEEVAAEKRAVEEARTAARKLAAATAAKTSGEE